MSARTEGRLTAQAGGFLVDADGVCVAATASPDTDDVRRLAACWNACEGFDTDHIENILIVGDTFKARFGMLQSEMRETLAERDQLRAELAAARALLGEVVADTDRELSDGVYVDDVYRARAERIRALLNGEPVQDRRRDAEAAAIYAVGLANNNGQVLTVWQRPRLPLAMGNYDTVVSVRPARERAA